MVVPAIVWDGGTGQHHKASPPDVKAKKDKMPTETGEGKDEAPSRGHSSLFFPESSQAP